MKGQLGEVAGKDSLIRSPDKLSADHRWRCFHFHFFRLVTPLTLVDRVGLRSAEWSGTNVPPFVGESHLNLGQPTKNGQISLLARVLPHCRPLFRRRQSIKGK